MTSGFGDPWAHDVLLLLESWEISVSNSMGILGTLTGELGSPVFLALSLMVCTAGGSFMSFRFMVRNFSRGNLWSSVQNFLVPCLVREWELWFVRAARAVLRTGLLGVQRGSLINNINNNNVMKNVKIIIVIYYCYYYYEKKKRMMIDD